VPRYGGFVNHYFLTFSAILFGISVRLSSLFFLIYQSGNDKAVGGWLFFV
jgi:hypothetical protein